MLLSEKVILLAPTNVIRLFTLFVVKDVLPAEEKLLPTNAHLAAVNLQTRFCNAITLFKLINC